MLIETCSDSEMKQKSRIDRSRKKNKIHRHIILTIALLYRNNLIEHGMASRYQNDEARITETDNF